MNCYVEVSGVKSCILPVMQPAVMVCDSPSKPVDAAGLLLSSAVYITSEWYSVVNAAFSRMKKSSASEGGSCGESCGQETGAVKMSVTESEQSKVDVLESISRILFGDAADYVKASFMKALATADRRSFKIRLIFFRFRNAIEDSGVREAFSNGMPDAITEAEDIAGCKPDPSKRRLSIAEQRRNMLRDKKRKQFGVQMDMFNDMPSGGWFVDAKAPESNEVEKPSNIIRKTRPYSCVAEISKDIEDGKITPYGTIEEVVADMKAGVISPSDASLFLAEIDKRSMSEYRKKIETISSKANCMIDDVPDEDMGGDANGGERADACYGGVAQHECAGYNFDTNEGWD